MNKETLMPDGRPLFAWENEIQMNRSQYARTEADRKELRKLSALLSVVEIEEQLEPHTGDYLIRVRRSSIAKAIDPLRAFDEAEVERV